MNKKFKQFPSHYIPTNKTAKDYYMYRHCFIDLMHKEIRQFYIKEISKEELILWNDEYINIILDELYKEIENEYSITSVVNICFELQFLNLMYNENKETYKRIFTLIKKMHHKYGYFMNYYTSFGVEQRHHIGFYVESLINKPKIIYNKLLLPNEQTLSKLTYFLPNAIYEGLIPTLYYLGYSDLYEEFMNDIVKPILSHFNEINQFVVDNKIIYYHFYNEHTLNNLSFSLELSKFFAEYSLSIPLSLKEYKSVINHKLAEINHSKRVYYTDYRLNLRYLDRDIHVDNCGLEIKTEEYFNTVNPNPIIEYNDYELNRLLDYFLEVLDKYKPVDNMLFLGLGVEVIGKTLKYYSPSFEINKKCIKLLKSFNNTYGYFLNYDFILKKGYSSEFLEYKTLLIREKNKIDKVNEKINVLSTGYYFEGKKYLGILPRLYYLGYSDLFYMFINEILVPICSHFLDNSIFIDNGIFTYDDKIKEVKDSYILKNFKGFLTENNLEMPENLKKYYLL